MAQKNLTLDDQTLKELDELELDYRLSASALIRRLIHDAYIDMLKRRREERALLEGA